MKNLFNVVKLTKPKKNAFDLSHDVKMTTKMGQLTPVMVQECVPGDQFKISCESLLRFAPLVSPVMHRMDVSIHYFFVPNRILWRNWEDFITDASTNKVAPFVPSDYFLTSEQGPAKSGTARKLADYLGLPLPPPGATTQNVSALPFAAYQAVYNEYYRDQNLITEIDYKLNDGDVSAGGGGYTRIREICNIRNRAWEHDYFTSCLPWAQKGAAVDIPLGEVELIDAPYNDMLVRDKIDGSLAVAGDLTTDAGGVLQAKLAAGPGANDDAVIDPNGNYIVGSTTINELRRAFRLQEWLEKNARGGTRYIENILSHFGVRSSDKRLQRPEYITGVKSPVIISEVLNTAGTFEAGNPTNPTSPVTGSMAGHALSVTSGNYGKYFCEEHGYIIGIMSVMPKTAYQQGIPRHFLKADPLDYFWPSFAHIGEQAVQNKELYAYTSTGNDTFGYVPRYAEYKFTSNRVAGDFRNTLDYWHLGRIFANQPALNQTFIECNPADVTRIFAVTDEDEDNLYCHVFNKVQALRPMPKFGNPQF